MNTVLSCALDLDGVFADFEYKVAEIAGIPFQKIPKNSVWHYISEYDKDVAPFFESLPVIPGSLKLFEFAKNNFQYVFILSACGNTPRNAAEQKRKWCKKVFGDVDTQIVVKSADKAKFATPHTILVDDRHKSIDPWVQAGGIGVLHQHTSGSINRLKEILEKFDKA